MTDKLTTEVIGFRQWIVGEDLGLGSAGHQGYTWTPGENVARCRSDEGHAAPHHDCGCGLYGLHAPTFWYSRKPKDDPYASMAAMMGARAPKRYAAGLIAAWGTVEVHHAGFRAERARIVAIAVPEGKLDAAIARGLAAEYGVSLVPQCELEQVASEYGSTVPDELRPPKGKDTPAKSMKSMAEQMAMIDRQMAQLQRGLSYKQPKRRSWLGL